MIGISEKSVISMRFVAVLALAGLLSGCVWLPISGKDRSSIAQHWSAAEMDALIGQSTEQVVSRISGKPLWQFSEGERSHLLYSSQSDFGLFLAGGGYSAGGGFTGGRNACYRLSFDREGRLFAYDRRVEYEILDGYPSEGPFDCRLVFWTRKQIEDARIELENRASKGEYQAAAKLWREHAQKEPLIALAEDSEQSDAAILLAREFDEFGPLLKRVAAGWVSSEEFEFAAERRISSMSWLGATSYGELKHAANSGDAKAQYALFRLGFEADPLQWLCRSANQKHPMALYTFGQSYEHGKEGLTRNRVQAYKWYRLAADEGIQFLEPAIERMRSDMNPDEKSIAVSLYKSWRPGACDIEMANH